MRCRLILLISEHPIQQGIRKGGGPHFCDEELRILVVDVEEKGNQEVLFTSVKDQ